MGSLICACLPVGVSVPLDFWSSTPSWSCELSSAGYTTLQAACLPPCACAKRVGACFGCRTYFDILVLGEECANPKPYPDPYQEALKVFGLQPQDAIVCEDSPSGELPVALPMLVGAILVNVFMPCQQIVVSVWACACTGSTSYG